jgi:hypothetical protein
LSLESVFTLIVAVIVIGGTPGLVLFFDRRNKKSTATGSATIARRSPPQPIPASARTGGRWVQASKWTIGLIFVFLGLAASYFAVWAVWVQSDPTVEMPAVTQTFDILPFKVTNQSHFFQMYSVSLICDTTSHGVVVPGSDKPEKIRFIVTTFEFDIPPQEATTMICSFPYMHDHPDEKVTEELSKVKRATVAVSAKYESRVLWWNFHRESPPASYAWEETSAGQRYWAPYDPNMINFKE